MSPLGLMFRLLTGCRQSEYRGIGFLEGHKELDGGMSFDGFSGTLLREMRSRMDQWLDGQNGPKKYFHNYKNEDPEHRNCFVFKYREHRLYGFLCNPKPDDRRFQLCALCIYATKFEWETEKSELDRVEQWCGSLGAIQAIAMQYPPVDKSGGKKEWKN